MFAPPNEKHMTSAMEVAGLKIRRYSEQCGRASSVEDMKNATLTPPVLASELYTHYTRNLRHLPRVHRVTPTRCADIVTAKCRHPGAVRQTSRLKQDMSQQRPTFSCYTSGKCAYGQHLLCTAAEMFIAAPHLLLYTWTDDTEIELDSSILRRNSSRALEMQMHVECQPKDFIPSWQTPTCTTEWSRCRHRRLRHARALRRTWYDLRTVFGQAELPYRERPSMRVRAVATSHISLDRKDSLNTS